MASLPSKPVRKKISIGVLVLIAAVPLLYFGVVRPMQVRQEKARFERASAQLDNVRFQIEAKIGNADEVNVYKKCDRANMKYQRGPLVCFVGLNMRYKNKDASTATQLMRQTSSFGTGQTRKGVLPLKGESFIPRDTQKGTQQFYQDYSPVERTDCSFAFSYPSDNDHDSLLTETEDFVIGLSCSSGAKAEHYPVDK
jgi:hypothetical protein